MWFESETIMWFYLNRVIKLISSLIIFDYFDQPWFILDRKSQRPRKEHWSFKLLLTFFQL